MTQTGLKTRLRISPKAPSLFRTSSIQSRTTELADAPTRSIRATVHIESFAPLEFLAELTAHIAQPYEKLTKTHGFYSNASRGKRRKMQEISQDLSVPPQIELSAPERPSRKDWARLIKKVYEIDPLVCRCGGKLKPIALIE
jgi:hypothetical protein